MKKVGWLVVAVLLLLVGCGTSTDTEKGYLTVDIDQVQQLQDDGAIVVDVREIEEFEEGHIIEAINVPLSEIKKGERANLSKDESYIIICRSGSRSKEASTILVDDGYDLVNVSEGMSSWTGEIEK
ncbi:rhodanese-like domain-containing protein [Sporosarcina sp. CAU 1771]